MGKAARRKQEQRHLPPDPHHPDPLAPVLAGTINPRTQAVQIPRAAHFWRALPGRAVQCDLCYRQCVLRPGEVGWCGYRRNDGGRLHLPDHAIISRSQPFYLGYMGGIHTYLLGVRALGIGGTRCTARCAYCTSANAVWAPEEIPWLGGHPRALGTDGSWWLSGKAILHPEGVIAIAKQKGARAIVFSENEPLLSFEFTYDCARLAQAAGLHVVVYTNGFSEPAVIQALAPYVDAVDVGIKGSLDPAFYAAKMRAPGAPDAVKRSLLAWRAAGVGHLLISDLIATHHQQPDDVQEAASATLYAWIVANLGPLTPVMLGHMHPVDGSRAAEKYTYLLPPREAEVRRYQARIAASRARAEAAGLRYAFHSESGDAIHCHACGGLLLVRHPPATPDGSLCPLELMDETEDRCTMFKEGCACWSHTQHITAGRCDHCGVAVPFVTFTAPAPDNVAASAA